MDRPEVVQCIVESTRAQVPTPPEGLTEASVLFGESGLLDSMALVQVALDVEQTVNEKAGTSIALASEKAMSRRNSPFRTVGSLADYVLELLGEAKRG